MSYYTTVGFMKRWQRSCGHICPKQADHDLQLLWKRHPEADLTRPLARSPGQGRHTPVPLLTDAFLPPVCREVLLW